MGSWPYKHRTSQFESMLLYFKEKSTHEHLDVGNILEKWLKNRPTGPKKRAGININLQ